MKSSKHIEEIYQVILKKYGPVKARQGLVSLISNLIFDLQESGQEITAEKIESALCEEAEFFKACEKEDVA